MQALSQSQVDGYRSSGYLHLPGILQRADLDPMRRAIDEAVDERARALYEQGKVPSLYEDLSFERRLVVLYDHAEIGVRSWNFLEQTYASRELFQLLCHAKLLDIIECLLGPEIAWPGSIVARTNLPQTEITTFPWHQDSQYYGEQTRHTQVITVWMPLVDVDERNGCLQLIPGSHTWGLLEGKRGADKNVRTKEDVEKRGIPVTVAMRLGDVLLFSNLTFHASKPNTTDTVRWSMDVRYLVPAKAESLTEQEQQAYDTLYTHYRLRPVTVRSRDPQRVVRWEQLRAASAL